MNRPVIVLFLLLASFKQEDIFAQCSDAGVCVIGKKQIDVSRKNTSSVGFGYVYGRSGDDDNLPLSQNDLTFSSLKLEAELALFKGSSIIASVPYTFISGPLGSTNGLGDMTVLWSKSIKLTGVSFLTVQAGAKFATGSVNRGDSLPQTYQPGLGTNDILVGAIYTYENFSVAGAYQKPFGRSNNKVTRLKRGDDVFVRMGYTMPFPKMNIKGEVLVIKRIQESSIRNPLGTEESFIDVDGSDPLQINLQGQVTYYASNEISVTGSAAVPLLRRDNNVDGLKRSFTASVSISYLFRIK